ncbi:MAG TPA: glycosyltransferase family 4 protein [Planctomycetaceae bacterium]|nr:glycosyltransferase family 4 protein [Planctomycetaceae bacterium]
MKVCVALEQRFYGTPDGAVWTDGPCARPFWDRYLEVFDEVQAIARVKPVSQAPAGVVRADGDGVAFAPVEYYIGPREYLRKVIAVRKSVVRGVGRSDAVMLRVPSNLASVLVPTLVRRSQPFAVEVVGDPYDAFSPGAVKHPLRPFLRRWFARELRQHCRQAFAGAYVTAEALQRRYPVGPNGRSFYYSDVQLSGLTAENARPATPKTAWKLITVGSLEHLYKSQDIQIDALARCRQQGLNVELILVGDGQHRSTLAERASRLGVAPHVHFRGQLASGAPIRDELDRADLFLLPSRQEGLPRAMIEAMARALPCIGSTVGGIPELLPPEDMVPPADTEALARKIKEIVSDLQRMQRMSARNLNRAGDFQEDVLRERRLEFYRYVREQTEEWLARTKPARLVAANV